MTRAFVATLVLKPQPINVGIEKIDGLPLEIYGMTSAMFSIQDSPKMIWFFEETFMLTNIGIKIVLKMAFLSFSNTDIKFVESKKTTW